MACRVRQVREFLGPIYTKASDNASTTLRWYLLKTIESLQIGVGTHFRVTPMFSMKMVSLGSLQSCRRHDTEAWCKRAIVRPLVTKPPGGRKLWTTKRKWSRSLVWNNIWILSYGNIYHFCICHRLAIVKTVGLKRKERKWVNKRDSLTERPR